MIYLVLYPSLLKAYGSYLVLNIGQPNFFYQLFKTKMVTVNRGLEHNFTILEGFGVDV